MAKDESKPVPLSTVAKDLQDAAKVGVLSGGAGFLVGTTAGVLRSTSPLLFGTASSIQWFGLGATFWAGRTGILSAWHHDRSLATQRDCLYASTIAGGLSGVTLALLTRGRRNVLPGGIMFCIFGGLGQVGADAINRRNTLPVEPSEGGGLVKWMAKQKWSPFSILTNAEYERILQEKILKLDVEISLVDDRLAKMRTAALVQQTKTEGDDTKQ